jgi:hypothetical protein
VQKVGNNDAVWVHGLHRFCILQTVHMVLVLLPARKNQPICVQSTDLQFDQGKNGAS